MRGLILAVCLIATPVMAADPRIQFVDYDPDRVVHVQGTLGLQLSLEFGADERIENVSIGDSLGWQVTPNRRANILFLKPIDGGATNMTVITDRRRYVFDLSVPKKAAGYAPYAVRFVYAAPAVALPVDETPADPVPSNTTYIVAGAAEAAPTRVFDDGQMTYFEWPAQGAIPAIFAVAADGSESVVNYGVRGAYLVVDQTAPRFVLRNGKQVATVVNAALAQAPAK